MKSYSQVHAERQASEQAARENARQLRESWARYLDEVKRGDSTRPVLHAQDPQSAHGARESVRWQITSGKAQATGVACDHCATELFFPTPDVIPLNGTRLVTCPGCGWCGGL
jgi:hypothetical protein